MGRGQQESARGAEQVLAPGRVGVCLLGKKVWYSLPIKYDSWQNKKTFTFL